MTGKTPTERGADNVPICKAIVRLAFRNLGFATANGFSYSKLLHENVLAGKGMEAHRDLYRCKGPEHRMTDEQIKALLPYLRTKGYEAPPDSFTRNHASPQDGLAYLRFGETLAPEPCNKKPPKHEDRINYHIGFLSNGINSIGEHFAINPEWSASRVASVSELAKLIEDHGLAARQVRDLDAFLSRIKTCQTCGAGALAIGAFQPLLDAVDRFKAVIIPKLGDKEEHRAFVRIIAQEAVRSSVTGNVPRARSAASFVMRTGMDGFLGATDTQEVIDYLRPVRSIIDPKDPAYGTFVEKQAEAYSEHSDAHMSALQCKACAAIAGRLDDAEFHHSEILLDRFRLGLERALRKNHGRREEETDSIRQRLSNADFLGLRFVEAKHRKAPDLPARIRDYARRHGFEIAGIVTKEKAPVRRAQALYWLWLAGNRKRIEHLKMARDLLEDNAHIKHVCVVEIDALRDSVRAGLEISGDRLSHAL